MSLVGYDASSSDEDDPDSAPARSSGAKGSSQHVGLKLFDLLPKPQGGNSSNVSLNGTESSKAAIRITAPEIPVLDSDDSDEDSAPAKRAKSNPSPSAQRSGLFAKLPAPINAPASGRKPKTENAPYSFTKPKKETKTPAVATSTQKASHLKGANTTNSESTAKDTTTSNSVLSIAEIRKRSAAAAAKLLAVNADKSKTNETKCDSDEEDEDVGFFSYVKKVSDDEIPEVEVPIASTPAMSVGPAPDVEYSPPQEQENSDDLLLEVPYPNQTMLPETLITPNPQEMLRLQGKRNRNETLNFIDFHEEDALKGGKEMLLKTISEEKGMDRTKVNVPGGMMKKKHQLPYLIQQAKAREVELKNTWAQNRQSKQQTQSKYGW